MSLAVAVVILWGSFGLLEGIGLDVAAACRPGSTSTRSRPRSRELDGVEAVHDLHIWPLSTTETALTAHIVAPQADYPDALAGERRGRCCTTASGSSIARSRSNATTSPTRTADA